MVQNLTFWVIRGQCCSNLPSKFQSRNLVPISFENTGRHALAPPQTGRGQHSYPTQPTRHGMRKFVILFLSNKYRCSCRINLDTETAGKNDRRIFVTGIFEECMILFCSFSLLLFEWTRNKSIRPAGKLVARWTRSYCNQRLSLSQHSTPSGRGYGTYQAQYEIQSMY